MSEIGDYLKSLRRSKNLSLRDVELASGVSNAYLSMIESGKRPAPHPNVLKKLADVYGEKLSVLMKLAGYLETSESEDEKLRVEKIFRRAQTDKTFSYGHRLRDNLDYPTKRFIVEMYERLKSEEGSKEHND